MVKSTKCFCRGPKHISYIRMLTTTCNSGSWGPSILSWTLWVPVLIHVYMCTHIYIIKNMS